MIFERLQTVSNGIGDELRLERQRQNFTLAQISQRTKISQRSLEAIEAEDFSRLPGIVFARNFVRLYALDLKLEPEGFVSRLPRVDVEAAPMPVPPVGGGNRVKRDPRLVAAFASVFWLATAVAGGTGAWYYYNNYGRHLITTVSAAPPPKHAATPSVTPMPSVSAPAPKIEQASTATEATSHPVEVVITAHDVVWVQVSADGQTAFVGTLHPNDTRTVSADDHVRILAGNAGGLDISLNGKALDPIGPKGQIRTVQLTAEGLQTAQQNPPSSSPL
jgi:cytoskeletal protein RodZ